MIDVANEIRKSVKEALKSQNITIQNYYSEVKEQGFTTPCIMIAPIGEGSQGIDYQLSDYQMRRSAYQVLYFPEEKTVFNSKTLDQRLACEIVANALIDMRYIGTLAIMYNVKYTITDGTLIFTFSTRLRGHNKPVEPFMRVLEENEGEAVGG